MSGVTRDRLALTAVHAISTPTESVCHHATYLMPHVLPSIMMDHGVWDSKRALELRDRPAMWYHGGEILTSGRKGMVKAPLPYMSFLIVYKSESIFVLEEAP
jgi:hypothetical protein